MQEKVYNIVLAGVGGQGVLKASDILSDAVFRAGYDVKKSEIHGMAQRGGSVATDIRFGKRIFSPMVPPGEADFLVLIEPDQYEPNAHRLREEGVVIKPEQIRDSAIAASKSLNVALLGALSTYLPIEESVWEDAVRSNLPDKYFAMNWKAFQIGRQSA